jgi:FdrA protein
MATARELTRLPGIADAALVMATEANQGILMEAGLLAPEAQVASPNDLVIAVRAGDEAQAEAALHEAERLLQQKAPSAGEAGAASPGGRRPRTLRAGAKAHPGANVAVISVAGRYAAREAWEALYAGLHVLLFSDNVSIEDERELKQYAVEHGLLMMGPGAGTAIINGISLGFANALPRGPVGIVSAAGTGLQEVSTLLAKRGVGTTQGIGTGGRDLKQAVGGLMMLAGLRVLQEDPATECIVLVSKPPDASVAHKILEQVVQSAKPTIVCLLGGDCVELGNAPQIHPARTLQEAALLASLPGGRGELQALLSEEDDRLSELAAALRPRLKPGQCDLRGLFSGGTLCYEAQVIWKGLLDHPVFSNAPLVPEHKMPDSNHSQGHSAIDLGEEEFTVGRPHPMIDNDLRIRRLMQEAADPATAVIVLDVVLGYGAHPDPASEIGPAIQKARALAAQDERELLVVASVTGTPGDPQGYSRPVQALEAAGVVVCNCNAAAARLTAKLVTCFLRSDGLQSHS